MKRPETNKDDVVYGNVVISAAYNEGFKV